MRIFALFVCGVILAGCSHAVATPIVPAGIADDGSALRGNGANKFRVLYNFKGGYDAWYPVSLINVNGTLYGTSQSGGGPQCNKNGCGTVFSVSTTGTERVVYSFKGGSDGIDPSGLVDMNGTFYGTTGGGGAGCSNGLGCGTVFSVTSAGKEHVLYRFKGGLDGAGPSSLIDVNGRFYGTTIDGGGTGCASGVGCGTVFSVTTTGEERVLYRFKGGTDGANPYAALIDVNGTLYGTTYLGGGSGCPYGGLASGCGTVFSVSTAGSEHVLYTFKGGTDGANSTRPLIGVNGTLYGATSTGGDTNCTLEAQASGCGTIFSVSLTGTERVLDRFHGGSDAADPHTFIDANGTFYGTSAYGGGFDCADGDGCGTIFSLTPTRTERVLYSFTNGIGQNPGPSLIDINGTLYGTTYYGGLNGRGSVYAFSL